MSKPERVPAAAPAGTIITALERDGVVIVEDLLDPDLLARFNAELDPLLEAASPGHDAAFINASVAAFFGERTRHVTGVAGRSRAFAAEVLVHPVLLALADHVLLPACASYLLNVAHVLDRGPGAERQWPHRDEIVWSHLPAPHPEIELSTVIALSEFTAANGATVVAPGSHRWPDGREPSEDELVAAEMAPGSAVVYYGSTVHAGGGNTTADRWRRGMHMSYVAGWLRTEENHYLSVPPDLARALPRRAQQLLGYGAHDALASGGGFLGAHELRDPLDALAAGRL